MRYKALISFNYGRITASSGEEVEIDDKGMAMDLERLNWVEPVEATRPKRVKE
jgi:hypothetical protein